MAQHLNPLHTPEMIAATLKTNGRFDLERGTGRSTAAKLAMLSKAIASPYTLVFPNDHRELSYGERKQFCHDVAAYAEMLGLREIYITVSPSPGISFGKV